VAGSMAEMTTSLDIATTTSDERAAAVSAEPPEASAAIVVVCRNLRVREMLSREL